MDALKNFLAKDWVKAAVAIIAFAVPVIVPLIPPIYGKPFLDTWNQYVMPLLVSLGVLSGGTSNLRSDQSRAAMPSLSAKQPTGYVRLSLLILLALGAAIVVSTPIKAKASPLVVCTSGCEQSARVLRQESPTVYKLDAPAPTSWFGPAVGLNGYTRSPDHVWQAGLVPGIGYGWNWRPASWTVTSSLFGINLYIQAALQSPATGPSTFNIDVLPVFTFMDLIAVGYGRRFMLATQADQKDRNGSLITFGILKTIGTP